MVGRRLFGRSGARRPCRGRRRLPQLRSRSGSEAGRGVHFRVSSQAAISLRTTRASANAPRSRRADSTRRIGRSAGFTGQHRASGRERGGSQYRIEVSDAHVFPALTRRPLGRFARRWLANRAGGAVVGRYPQPRRPAAANDGRMPRLLVPGCAITASQSRRHDPRARCNHIATTRAAISARVVDVGGRGSVSELFAICRPGQHACCVRST